HHDHFDRLAGAGIHFLMRNIGRHIDKIAGAGFVDELEMVAPAHPRASADDIEHAFELAMVLRAGLRVRLYDDGPGPKLAGAGLGVSDGGGARHARRLRRVHVQLVGMNDADAVVFPVGGHRDGSRWDYTADLFLTAFELGPAQLEAVGPNRFPRRNHT